MPSNCIARRILHRWETTVAITPHSLQTPQARFPAQASNLFVRILQLFSHKLVFDIQCFEVRGQLTIKGPKNWPFLSVKRCHTSVLRARIVPPRSFFLHTTVSYKDKASQILAQELPPGVRNTYRARAEKGNVSYTTLYYRAHGRCSITDKKLEPIVSELLQRESR